MKPGIPWSVKGIDSETREAAKDAARRSGLTLGEWLNSMILDTADGAPVETAPPPPRYNRQPSTRDETSIALGDIAEQLARIARREQDTSPARSSYQSDTRAEESETLSKILNRVESNERQTVEAFSAMNERLAALGRQIVQSKATPIVKPEEPAAIKSLETAVRNIVEHIEVSEKRTRENLKTLQDRMAEMAHKANGSNSEQIIQSAPAFTRLESRLSELAGRVERSESNADTNLPEVLRKELSHLTERIEYVREQSEILATKAQTAAVQTSQQELREIEKRILTLLKEAQSAFAGGGGSNAEMQKLRSEIAALNNRIDVTRNDAASERDVHALRIALEQLSTRVAQGPDMRPIADLDKRLADVTQRLEQSQVSGRNNPHLGELERRMAELDHRLNEAMQSQGNVHAQSALEQKIAEVADRVGRTEHQLGHLETIERAINQLFESIEQSRNWSKDVAEDAANRMADRLMSAAPAAHQPQGPSPELQALEDGLRAVRESAVGADQRNQETLQAVHETLEQIVVKLADLETSAVGQQVAAAVQNIPAFAVPQQTEPEAWMAAHVMPAVDEYRPPAPETPEAVAPLEPNPLADWLANSKIPSDLSATTVPQSENSEPPSDDFLAMARRLAIASQKNGLGSLMPAKAATLKPPRRGFRLPFKKAAKGDAVPVAAAEKILPSIKPATENVDNKRRTLWLAGLVALAAVSAILVTTWSKGATSSQSVAPMSFEDSAKPFFSPAAPKKIASSSQQSSIKQVDGILTGSLPVQKSDTTLSSLVAQPGTISSVPELPPEELGTLALRKAAERGDAQAQFIVATRYLDGQSTTQDVTRAAHWYQKAAEAGLAPAQYRLATLFERGRGVPLDTHTALVWYERAAQQGNVKAMHNAAVLAAGTEAGAARYDVAFKWFLAASRNGLKDSQFNLAVLFERGLGTPPNSGEALFWYMVAAAQKDSDAQKRVDVLSRTIPPATVDAISGKARSWVPDQAPASANIVAIKDAAWQQGSPMAQNQPAPSAPLNTTTAADPVSTTQQLLMRLGFNIGEPDGKMGARTVNAIRLFQLQAGVKVTGEVTADLLNQLQAKLG